MPAGWRHVITCRDTQDKSENPTPTVPKTARWAPRCCRQSATICAPRSARPWPPSRAWPTLISPRPARPPGRQPAACKRVCGRLADPTLQVSGMVLIAATGLAAVVSLAVRYRQARTAERAQLRRLVYAGLPVLAAALIGLGPVVWIMGAGHRDHQPAEHDGQRDRRAPPGGRRHRRPAVPAVRHRPGHLPNPGLRDRHRPAGRDLRRPGPAGHPGAPDPQRGRRGRRHADRRGPVQPGAAAGAARGGPAVQPGQV